MPKASPAALGRQRPLQIVQKLKRSQVKLKVMPVVIGEYALDKNLRDLLC